MARMTHEKLKFALFPKWSCQKKKNKNKKKIINKINNK